MCKINICKYQNSITLKWSTSQSIGLKVEQLSLFELSYAVLSIRFVQISMPSGAYVTAEFRMASKVYKPSKYFMDIFVYPLNEDRNQGSGLCGNYNGIPHDDLTPAGSTVPDKTGDKDTIPLIFPRSYG